MYKYEYVSDGDKLVLFRQEKKRNGEKIFSYWTGADDTEKGEKVDRDRSDEDS